MTYFSYLFVFYLSIVFLFWALLLKSHPPPLYFLVTLFQYKKEQKNRVKICGFVFDPCGYSINAIEGAAISTIHVTPEDEVH
jgi:hypothetical protein